MQTRPEWSPVMPGLVLWYESIDLSKFNLTMGIHLNPCNKINTNEVTINSLPWKPVICCARLIDNLKILWNTIWLSKIEHFSCNWSEQKCGPLTSCRLIFFDFLHVRSQVMQTLLDLIRRIAYLANQNTCQQ